MFNIIIRILNKNRFSRSLLLVLSSSMSYEFKDYMTSKIEWSKLYSFPSNLYRLRRNIHRIEKGLIHPNRRKSFGLSYINMVMLDFENLTSNGLLSSTDIKYFGDILKEYERVTDLNPDLRERLRRILNINVKDGLKSVPYELNIATQDGIDRFWPNLLASRRSVRYFSKEVPTLETVKLIVQDAVQSPSPCNRNSIKYQVMFDKNSIVRVGSIVGGARTFIHQVPCLIAVIGDANAYPGLYDRHARYIETGLQSMTFMYSATTRGLSTCPINWPRVKAYDTEVSSVLDLKNTERVMMLIALGYPDKNVQVAFSGKADIKTILSVV